MKHIITILFFLCAFTMNAQTNVVTRSAKQQTTTAKPKAKPQQPAKPKAKPQQPAKPKTNANTIYVSNEKQFLDALGSNKTIIVQKSINLTSITQNELYIKNYSNLTIKGVNPQIRLGVSRGENLVLGFGSCNNITISNLVLGHENVLWCGAGVLEFDNCTGVNISNCDIYGCGYYGIVLYKTRNVTCTNNYIHDCHVDMLDVNQSSNIKFRNTKFQNSKMGTIISIWSSEQVEFDKCSFIDATHTGEQMYGHKCFSLNCYITLKNCTIHYTNTYGDTNFINQVDCKWY